MEHQNGEMEHQNEEMEHQNGEMDWFEYTPGCKRGIQPPGCNSTTTRMLSEVLISYTATFFFLISYTAPVFFQTERAQIMQILLETTILRPKASGGRREDKREKIENLVFSQNRISIDVTFP